MELKLSDRNRIDVSHNDAPLFTYVVEPECPPLEFNRPYLHPMRTLAGDVVTNDRTNDHAWHKGLSLTLTVVNSENFWGGGTYVHGTGYVQKNNVGRTVHREWLSLPTSGADAPLADLSAAQTAPLSALDGASSALSFSHLLDWQTARGETWLRETRTLACDAGLEHVGGWRLIWGSRLENVSGKRLTIGSPTTKGRTAAGYGGLFWRGARDLHGGQVSGDGDLSGEDAVNGTKGRWLAYSGKHDGSLRQSMLVFRDHPQNPRYPTPWFVRSTQYAGVCPNFAYHQTFPLKPGAVIDLRYAVFVVSGVWEREEIERAAAMEF